MLDCRLNNGAKGKKRVVIEWPFPWKWIDYRWKWTDGQKNGLYLNCINFLVFFPLPNWNVTVLSMDHYPAWSLLIYELRLLCNRQQSVQLETTKYDKSRSFYTAPRNGSTAASFVELVYAFKIITNVPTITYQWKPFILKCHAIKAFVPIITFYKHVLHCYPCN